MKKQEFITLARFSSFEQAQVVKALLDSMGIDNEIMNAMAAQVMPYLESDIRIMVNSKDYASAKRLLEAKFDKKELITGAEMVD